MRTLRTGLRADCCCCAWTLRAEVGAEHRAVNPGRRASVGVRALRTRLCAELRTDRGVRVRAIHADVRTQHRAVNPGRRASVGMRALRTGLCAELRADRGVRVRALRAEMRAQHRAVKTRSRAAGRVRALSNDLGADRGQRLRSAERLRCEGKLLLATAAWLTGGADAGDALSAGDALASGDRRTVDATDVRTLRSADGQYGTGWTLNRMRRARRPGYG